MASAVTSIVSTSARANQPSGSTGFVTLIGNVSGHRNARSAITAPETAVVISKAHRTILTCALHGIELSTTLKTLRTAV